MSWVWAGWLALIAVTFSVMEGYAIAAGKSTLSRFIWNLSKSFPLFPWVVGVLVGVLAAHFWWGGAVCFAPASGFVPHG
jgi:hypothetical protein